MKVVLLFWVGVFISCGGVPKEYLANDNACHYDDPIFTVTPEEMTLDVKKYDGILSEEKSKNMVDNTSYRERILKHSDAYYTNKQT